MDAIDIVIVLFLVWWICANSRSGKEEERSTVLGTLRDYVWPDINRISARAIARDVPAYALFLGLFIAADLALALYHGKVAPADYDVIAEYLACVAYFGVVHWYGRARLWTLFAFPAALLAVGAGFLLRDYFRGTSLTGNLAVAVIFAPLVVNQFRAWLWLVRFGARGDAAPAGKA